MGVLSPEKSRTDPNVTCGRWITLCATCSATLISRLRRIFAGVVDQPLVLGNSRNSPLFMLVFAASNPIGARPALRIANYIVQAG